MNQLGEFVLGNVDTTDPAGGIGLAADMGPDVEGIGGLRFQVEHDLVETEDLPRGAYRVVEQFRQARRGIELQRFLEYLLERPRSTTEVVGRHTTAIRRIVRR